MLAVARAFRATSGPCRALRPCPDHSRRGRTAAGAARGRSACLALSGLWRSPIQARRRRAGQRSRKSWRGAAGAARYRSWAPTARLERSVGSVAEFGVISIVEQGGAAFGRFGRPRRSWRRASAASRGCRGARRGPQVCLGGADGGLPAAYGERVVGFGRADLATYGWGPVSTPRCMRSRTRVQHCTSWHRIMATNPRAGF